MRLGQVDLWLWGAYGPHINIDPCCQLGQQGDGIRNVALQIGFVVNADRRAQTLLVVAVQQVLCHKGTPGGPAQTSLGGSA